MIDQREIDAAFDDLAQAAADYCAAEEEFSRRRLGRRDSSPDRMPRIVAEHAMFAAWRAWRDLTAKAGS